MYKYVRAGDIALYREREREQESPAEKAHAAELLEKKEEKESSAALERDIAALIYQRTVPFPLFFFNLSLSLSFFLSPFCPIISWEKS